MEIKNQQGQTVVEYILLLSVAVSLVTTFYNSATFQKYFGTQGQLGKVYKVEAEWGYRHASMTGRGSTPEGNSTKSSAIQHASYYNTVDPQTHFFGPSDPYQ
jgi:hypothetical protein